MAKMNRDYNDKEYIKNLIERCIQRDRASWDEFAQFISPLISSIIQDRFWRSGFNCQKCDIDNIRQDILLSIWEKKKLETIKDKEKVIPWICVISNYAVSNYIRNLKPVDPPKAVLLNDSLQDHSSSPSDELLNKYMQDDIDHALKSLSHKENLIIKLSLLYGKKYREISEILHIPMGTVLVYAGRARLKLKKN